MSRPNVSYYAVIPANVRYDEHITPNAKLLFGEITALCNEKGYCWATNQYFADLYKVSKVSVSKWINQLIGRGYLFSTINFKEGSKEIDGRYLSLVNDPIKEKLMGGIKEKFKDNNTYKNNTSNNTPLPPKGNDNEFSFDKFWDSYDKKIDRPKCERKWAKLSAADKQAAITYIPGYVKTTPDKQFRKNPATFLNNRAWENELPKKGEINPKTEPFVDGKLTNSQKRRMGLLSQLS